MIQGQPNKSLIHPKRPTAKVENPHYARAEKERTEQWQAGIKQAIEENLTGFIDTSGSEPLNVASSHNLLDEPFQGTETTAELIEIARRVADEIIEGKNGNGQQKTA